MPVFLQLKSIIRLPYVLAVCGLLQAGIVPANGQSADEACNNNLAVLKGAVANSESFFIKVHAAEHLIHLNYPEGLEAAFLQLKQDADNEIGAVRVLARLNRQHPEKYNRCIRRLLYLFQKGATGRVRLTALESLAKLGYSQPLPAISAYADTGTGGFKGMARWILANNNDANENSLSALLLSADSMDYRYAAYALQFRKRINPLTRTRLYHCLQKISIGDAARVYVAGSLLVHGKGFETPEVKEMLLAYAAGDAGQRYEVAEVLALAGTQADIPVLRQLLADASTDVRVAAANALMQIMHCHAGNHKFTSL